MATKKGAYNRMESDRMTQAQAIKTILTKKDKNNWTISGDWFKGFRIVKK